ncbi:MAG: HYR domain-containing protein [Prevotellaceae bacterium]|jgi:uncharacterized repeat protein (TIGR01451 family)|nr:HYR domain-containing protein [Prevotellaceae bacterium]
MDSLYYTITGATHYTGPKSNEINLLNNYTFNKGVSVVTYTVKNALGLSSSSTFSVTVEDQEAPVITCKNGDVYLDATGHAVLDVSSTLIATATDNCDATSSLVYKISPETSSSFSCADLGEKQVNVRAIDVSNNHSSLCAATVTVHNDQPPLAVCKPKDTVYVSVNSGQLNASHLAAASSTSHCNQQLAYYILDSNTDTGPTYTSKNFPCTEGGTTHTVYVGVVNTENNKMAVCSTEVLVTDTVLQCTAKGIDTLYLPATSCSYTLTPAIDGNLIPMSVATPYRGCQDILQPVAGMKLENNKDFDIYKEPFPNTKFAAGVHEITWTLKDDFGIRATCEDVFAVIDTVRPTFSKTLSASTYYLAPGSCAASVNWSPPGFTDNCTGVTLRRTDALGGPLLDLAAGDYLIKYVAEDKAGNVSRDTSKIRITVTDQNAPVIAEIANTIMQVDNATDCFATVPAGGLRPEISGVCLTGSTVTYTASHAGAVPGPNTIVDVATGLGGVRFNVGATAVTYTVTAANGKTAQRGFTVHVQDTVKPKITCKSDLLRNYDVDGKYKVSENELDVTVAKKCVALSTLLATIDGGGTTYATLANHIFTGKSSFAIRWTATDAAGNTSSCDFTLTMDDNIPPVFTSFPDTIRVNTNTDDCGANVSAAQLAAVYTDNVTPAADIGVAHTITYKGNQTVDTGLLPEIAFQHDTTKVTYTITDAAGNSCDSSFLVIVIDSVPPVLSCPTNVTGLKIAAPLTGCVALPTTLTGLSYSDNCGAVKTLSWSVTGSRGAQDTSSNYGGTNIKELTSYQFAAGTNTVRYTATDSSGNTAVCSFTVEVADEVPPACESVSSYTLKLQGTPTTTLEAQWIDNGSTDNCGALTYALSVPADATFGCSDIGKVRDVYLVVSDDFGNKSQCDNPTKVSVADTIVPVVHCEGAITVYLDAQASASLTAIDLKDTGNPVTDNCTASDQLQYAILQAGGTTATADSIFDCAAVGQAYTLTLRVLDESGNAGTCTSVVTVRDTLLKHRGKVTIPADQGACVATLSDTLNPAIVSGCSAATLTNSNNTATYAGIVLSVGTHYVTWTLDDGKGVKTVKTVADTIIVADTQKPVLDRAVLMKDIVYSTTAVCTTDVAVSWMEPDNFIGMNPSDTLAKDNCTDAGSLTWHRVDTNLTRVVNGSGTVPAGRWIIRYVAEDAAGNQSDTLGFFVVVNNNNTPVITNCPGSENGGKDTVFVAPGACTATVPERFTPAVSGLCPGADSLSYAYTFNGGAAGNGAGSLEGLDLPAGLYSVTYTATNKFASTDASAATATCMFTLAVRDTIKPAFTCPSGQSRNPEGLYYTVGGTEFDLESVSDNCGVASITHDFGTGGGASLAGVQIPAGSAPTITWKVVDVHGNADSCEFTLTIGDKVKPNITLNETPTVYLDNTGNGVLLKDLVIIHMSDNATDSSAIATTLTPSGFTCADIGSVPGTFTATDAAKNDTIKAITITVRDTIAPTFTLRNPTVYLDAAGNGNLTMDSVIVALADNCTPRTSLDTSLIRTSFTCDDIALSPVTVTFTAKDKHGNERSGNVAVTVTDTVKPQITCVSGLVTKSTRDTDCNYQVNAGEFDPTVVDRCGGYTLVHNYGGGGAILADTLLPAGTHAITWTVTNLSGNIATCDVTVKVTDTVPPVFTVCPSSVTEIILNSSCTATATIETPAYSDNCMLDSLTWSIRHAGALRDSSNGVSAINIIPADYQFSAGTNVVTYIVTDTSGNRSVCSFTVPVKDVVAPVCASVAAYTLKLQGPGTTTLDPKLIDNGSSDNCTAPADLSFSLFGNPDFTCADIGAPRTVYLYVTDVSGYKNTCSSPTTITVIDTIAPEAKCVADTTLYVDSSGEISLSAASLDKNSTDNCSPVLAYSFRRIDVADTTYAADTTFKCANIGTFGVTVAVADAYNNRGTCTVQVTVKDTLKPVIHNRGQITVPTTGTTGCAAVLSDTLNPVIKAGSICQTISGVTNSANNADTYAGLSLSAGTHEITWTAVANGYTATAVDTITVIDTLAPAVKGQMTAMTVSAGLNNCESENPVSWMLPENYTSNSLVEDNCTASDALTWTRVDATGIVFGERAPAGIWKIQYVATDEAGNQSDTVGFVLTVKKSATPVLDCPSGVITLDIDAANVCYATAPATFTPTITGLGCNVDSLAYKITGGALTEEGAGSLAGRQLPVGQHSATYTVFNRTDLSQQATCAFEIEVRDTAKPVINVRTAVDAYLEASGSYTLPMDSVIVSLSDNCTPRVALDTSLTRDVFTCADVGAPVTVTFKAKDGQDNETSQTITVNVYDTLPPVINVRTAVDAYLEASGSYTLPMDSVIVSLSDNCTPRAALDTSLTPDVFTCADMGTPVTVTFTAKDGQGNETSQTITVNVRDTIKPVVTCKPDTVVAINAAGDAVTLTAKSLVTATAMGCAANTALTYSFSNSAADPDRTYNCTMLGSHPPLAIYVTDANNNVASCMVTVTVKDTLPPVITKKNSITAATSPVKLTIADVLAGVTDNCTASPAVTFKNATLGSTTFTCANNVGWIYAEDASGNKDTVVFNVIFTSSAPATVTAHDTTLYLDAAGKAALSAYEVVKTVDDGACVDESVFENPANGLLTLSQTYFTCSDGVQTVTIYAQGAADTPGSATFTVTALDTLKPAITCASGASVKVDDATCRYKVTGNGFDPVTTEDNCSVMSILHDYQGGGATLADTLLPVGAHTITWTVTDASGNSATCETVITVDDSKAPAITCKTTGYVAYLDNGGSVVVDAKDLVDVTEECAPVIALTYTFDDYGVGTHTYACGDTSGVQSANIRVTDLSGNSSVCMAQFTVRDALPPVIVLKNPIQLTVDGGTNVTPPITKEDVLDFTGTKDNCTAAFDLVVDITPQTYSCKVNAGTVTVTDKQGLSSSATFSVTLNGVPPMQVTAPDVTLTLTEGTATLSAYNVVKGITDACADVDAVMNPANGWITLSRSTFTCSDVGKNVPNTIFVRRDASAAPEIFTFNVTVHNTPPVISCTPGFNHVTITVPEAKCDTIVGAQIDQLVKVTGNCYTLENNRNNSATLVGEKFGIGAHTITWTVTDNDGHAAACDVTLTVLDKHAPDIVCVSDTLLALDAAGVVSIKAEDLLESADDCGSLTYAFDTGESEKQYGCGDIGTYALTVKVTDASNNFNTCTAQVRIKDTLPPLVTVNSAVTVKAGETVAPAQVIVALSDNCTSPDDVRNSAQVSPTAFTCAGVGAPQAATITVSDKAGNPASATFTVNVEAMKPAYTALGDITLYACNPDTLPSNTGEITPADVTVCGNAPVAITYTNTSNRGADKTKGDYYNYVVTRTWTVSAGAGNDSVTVQVISVRDATPPLIVTESALAVYLGQDGTGTPGPGKALRSVQDCADSVDVTIQYSVPEFNCSHIGTPQTVAVTGTDPSGNVSAPSTVTLTVQDTLPPVFTAHNATLLLDASGAATLTQSAALATLRDNCTDSSGVTVSFSRNVFYVNDMGGAVPVWVYVEDQWNNKDSVQVMITVIDDIARETTIEKSIQGGRNAVNKGDTVTFVLTVTNVYGGDRSLIIVDSLPEGLSLVENSVPNNSFVNLIEGVVTINHGLLAEGATVSYAIAARVEQPGMCVNHAYLYRAEQRIDEDKIALTVLQPELALTAKIREGDYTNTEASPVVYNVPGDYHLVVTLENKGGATVNRIDVQVAYDATVQQFAGSSGGADVTDNGNGLITWTVYNFEGYLNAELEITFIPLIAATYTFVNEITTYLPYEENPSDNSALVSVNQVIVKVSNVLTSEYPELYIKDLDNDAITEATMRVVNTWGNQVYYISRREDAIKGASWFNSANVARGTYWYELTIRYANGTSYVIRDYVEVLK